jgi:hypothetical protein
MDEDIKVTVISAKRGLATGQALFLQAKQAGEASAKELLSLERTHTKLGVVVTELEKQLSLVNVLIFILFNHLWVVFCVAD